MNQSSLSTRVKAFYWPELFYQSLADRPSSSLSSAQLFKINEANQNIWESLNIFDDFLDKEGRVENLPLAISKYRSFITFFYKLNLNSHFYTTLESILKNLDQANRQELINQRLVIKNGRIPRLVKLPNQAPLINLSNKSLALALGPLAVLYLLRGSDAKPAAKKVLTFFRFTLAAKQLADDSQDWQEDLQAGQLTEANRPVIENSKTVLKLNNVSPTLLTLFANYASPVIIKNLSTLCRCARESGVESGLAPNSPLIEEMIGPIENGLWRAITFRQSLETSA